MTGASLPAACLLGGLLRGWLLVLSLWLCPCLVATHATNAESYLPGDNESTRRALVLVTLARIRELGMSAQAPPRKELEQARQLLGRTPSRYGMFVSLFRKRDAALAGCMGGTVPQHETLLQEVEHWTMMALSQDLRVRGRRRGELTVILSFVAGTEPVSNPLLVDSFRDGLLVRHNGQEALVLPGEARTSAVAHRLVLAKLGLSRAEAAHAEVFRVRAVRFGPGRRLFAPGKPTGG